MKKVILIIVVQCLLCFVDCCSIVQGQTSSQSAIEVDWKSAETLYAEKQYAAAAEIYAKLFQYGESSTLYYNYANALYKSNQLGLAILNYERALRLDPTNDDIKFNLEFVNKMKTDKIEPLERFFLSVWMESLSRMLTSNQWAYVSIVSFIAMLILALLYLLGKRVWLRKVFTMVNAFSVKNYIENNPEAIVLVGSVSVKSSPDDSGTEVFVIHEGTKVNVLSTLANWSEVRLADGNVGWLLSSAIEKI